jgi:hypothetical protein
MYDSQDDGMVVIPAYQYRIEAQEKIHNARRLPVHNAKVFLNYNFMMCNPLKAIQNYSKTFIAEAIDKLTANVGCVRD